MTLKESSSDDDSSVSYESSSAAAEAQIQLYLNKITKLEAELKAVKRENFQLKEQLNLGSPASLDSKIFFTANSSF